MYSNISEVWKNNKAKKNNLSELSLSSEIPITTEKKVTKKVIPKQEKINNCDDTYDHIKACNYCYDKIQKMINNKINQRLDEIMLEKKINKIDRVVEEKNNDKFKMNTETIAFFVIIFILFILLLIFIVRK